jgi:formiminoglutamase
MSGRSTSAAGSSTPLVPAAPPSDLARRPDDPRLGEFVTFWSADLAGLPADTPAVVGFPQDEGVRRNGGRVGAAAAPAEIRRWLYRLVPFAASPRLIDLGDVVCDADLAASQARLGAVVAAVLRAGGVPVVLGGGHETAFGSYLGYALANRDVGIINIDAHLDVRPTVGGLGHSGSPFRQALEHPGRPLPGACYACLGAQPFSVSGQHAHWLAERGGRIRWAGEVQGRLESFFLAEHEALQERGCAVQLSIDADVVRAADVPGVSAPNPLGLDGREVARLAYRAGTLPGVAGLELVEINPAMDIDGRSARWGALVVWHFLAGRAGGSDQPVRFACPGVH